MKGKKEGRRSSNEERIKYREREGQRSRDEGGGGRGQRRAGESPAGPGPRPWGAPRPQEWQQLVYSEQEARPGPSGQPSAVFLQMALQPLLASSQAFQLCHTPSISAGDGGSRRCGWPEPSLQVEKLGVRDNPLGSLTLLHIL